MNLVIAQAANLAADYIYKTEHLGIDICMDSRVFLLINKDYISLCDYTSDCAIKEVVLPTFNNIKTCAATSITDITPSSSSCSPITIKSQCTYTATGLKRYINRVTINSTNISFSAFDLQTEASAFENFLKTFLDSQDFALSTVEVTGSYTLTITTTSEIIDVRTADDVSGTGNTVTTFNKDCRI